MESTRDVRRMIDKEIKKGSAPLVFDHIEYKADSLQEITSESKLKEVLVYLFRTAEFEELASEMTRNNVYSENLLIRGDNFHRCNNVMERNANYMNIIMYAKRCSPVYEHKTFVETVPCYFSFPKERMEEYKFVYDGRETYAFPLSGKHIINGLYLMCIMNRKALAGEDAPDSLYLQEQLQIYHLEEIRKVVFQCLLMDDMHFEDGLFKANLYTIYLL